MSLNIIALSPFSCSLELINQSTAYYSEKPYDVYVNDKLVISKSNHNVISIYDLDPNTKYQIKIQFEDVYQDFEMIEFITDSVTKIINVKPGNNDDTLTIQQAIDNALGGGAVVLESGTYYVRPLLLKNDLCLYLKKGVHLLYSTNRLDYPVLDEFMDELPLGTWEGLPYKMFTSCLTGLRVKNVKVVGEGLLDGNAQNGDWWIDHRNIKIASRPRNIFLNYCSNILIQGLNIHNSAAWTIHPHYTNNLKLIDLKVVNPKNSPNTDGCDPESSTNVEIIGCFFSVGDDCIAIKSGKKAMADSYYQPTEKMVIRNCLMQDGHGAIVLGSEMSSGIKNLDVCNCLFVDTDRGLRIKTRRGRGQKAIVDNVVFENITMKGVLNPFVINMFYFCDPDGKTEYVQNKKPQMVDENTPYLGKFTFKNINCEDSLVSAGFFYGLPEQKIKEINFENVFISMKNSNTFGYPAMMLDIEKVNQIGCYFNNVENININNLTIENQKGEALIFNNVNKYKINNDMKGE